MKTGFKIAGGLAAAAMVWGLTGCMDHPPAPRHPGPYNEPVDAFDATDTPYDANAAGGPSRPLSDDMAHLRDARAAYEHSQAVQAARTRDKQEKCRQQPDARLVHIDDGTGDPDAVYCQTAPGGSSDAGGS